jgi:hypothetical protein
MTTPYASGFGVAGGTVSMILPVPADRVGLVVGKARACLPALMCGHVVWQGGSTIRQIQEVSKTHVHVPPAVPGVTVCNIQISGRPEQLSICSALIQQCIAPLTAGGITAIPRLLMRVHKSGLTPPPQYPAYLPCLPPCPSTHLCSMVCFLP